MFWCAFNRYIKGISHKLLLAKLNAYGFSLEALRLVHSSITNRKQRTKVNLDHSSWEQILFEVHTRLYKDLYSIYTSCFSNFQIIN